MKKYAKVALVVILAFLLPWAATFAEEADNSGESASSSDPASVAEQDEMTFTLSAEADEKQNVSITLGLENPNQTDFHDMEASVSLPEGMTLTDTDGEREAKIPIDPQGDGKKLTLMLSARIDSPDPAENLQDASETAESVEKEDPDSQDVAKTPVPDADETGAADATETESVVDKTADGAETEPVVDKTADGAETEPVVDKTADGAETEETVSSTASDDDPADETIVAAPVAAVADSKPEESGNTVSSAASPVVTQSGSNVKTGIENLGKGLMVLGLAFVTVMIGLYARRHKGNSGRFLSIALAFAMMGFGLPMVQDVEAADTARTVSLSTTLSVEGADYPVRVDIVYQLAGDSDTSSPEESDNEADASSERPTENTTLPESPGGDTAQDADTGQSSDTDGPEEDKNETLDDADADDNPSGPSESAEDSSKAEAAETDDSSKTDSSQTVESPKEEPAETEDSSKEEPAETEDSSKADPAETNDPDSGSQNVSYSGEIHTATRSIPYTTDGSETVREIIANSGVALGGYDLTDPGLDETISQDKQTITVTRIAYKTKVETESIPYGTYEYEDNSIETGKTKVKQKGVTGVRELTYKVKYVNGQATDEKELISDEVTREMVSEIILVGTGPKSGISSETASDGTLLIRTSGGLGWYWPVDGNAGGCFLITSLMGTRESPGGIGSTNHQGTDIAADNRSKILAVQNGRVTQSGWNSGYGNSVTIVTTDGYTVLYGHLSQCNVSVGATVSAGQTVGLEGSTGNSTGPHLHFEVRLNGNAINGLSLYGEDIYNKLSYALDA